MATILPASDEAIREAVLLLCNGQPVALPTETVYGLAADALNEEACQRIFVAKGRPANDPLIVHVADFNQAEELAHTTDAARKLTDKFWPGPLTILLPKKECVPSITTSGLPSVALRCPDNAIFLNAIRESGLPLAAPSANRFGKVSPTSAEAVQEELGDRIELIIDGGECEVGLESTIVDLTDEGSFRILRPGKITQEQIEDVLGIKQSATSNEPIVPGSLPQHYQPSTPVELFEQGTQPEKAANMAIVYFYKESLQKNEHNLSGDGTMESAAHNLYGLLRKLDKEEYSKIFVEKVKPEGIGQAIQNRLGRAARR